MTVLSGFPPVVAPDAETLILGSMPGEESLKQQQYYAHPRNSFWFIMAELYNTGELADYAAKESVILNNKLALWDVLQNCIRPGSLDAAIEESSIVANDFAGLFAESPGISRVFFNGRKAEASFRKYVLSTLPEGLKTGLQFQCLPSTSPAMASLRPAQKLDTWRVILE